MHALCKNIRRNTRTRRHTIRSKSHSISCHTYTPHGQVVGVSRVGPVNTHAFTPAAVTAGKLHDMSPCSSALALRGGGNPQKTTQSWGARAWSSGDEKLKLKGKSQAWRRSEHEQKRAARVRRARRAGWANPEAAADLRDDDLDPRKPRTEREQDIMNRGIDLSSSDSAEEKEHSQGTTEKLEDLAALYYRAYLRPKPKNFYNKSGAVPPRKQQAQYTYIYDWSASIASLFLIRCYPPTPHTHTHTHTGTQRQRVVPRL